MQPTVSVILPVLDEERHILDCLTDLQAQTYQNILEILIADGGSTDETRSIIQSLGDRRIRVVDNPGRLQSHGLNLLLPLCRGEIVVRADAHTRYATDYVAACVEALTATGAWVVGGPQIPVELATGFGVGVAKAMTEPWATGPAAFRRGKMAAEVDTVYLGAFPAWVFDRVGGYRVFPSGVSEDADICDRIRRAGGTVMLDPAIRSAYHPRTTVTGLWRQYLRYGMGKAEMARVNRRLPTLRPIAPALLVLVLTAGGLLAVSGSSPLLLVAGAVGWLGLVGGLSLRHGRDSARVAAAAAVIHLAYGIGFWIGLLRRVGHVAPAPDVRRVIPPPPAT